MTPLPINRRSFSLNDSKMSRLLGGYLRYPGATEASVADPDLLPDPDFLPLVPNLPPKIYTCFFNMSVFKNSCGKKP
jgi:hypothetical protein